VKNLAVRKKNKSADVEPAERLDRGLLEGEPSVAVQRGLFGEGKEKKEIFIFSSEGRRDNEKKKGSIGRARLCAGSAPSLKQPPPWGSGN